MADSKHCYEQHNDYFSRLVHGPLFEPGEEMKYEAVRLASFSDWPHWSQTLASRLARVGFYYSGIGDEVTCFSCCGRINRWERKDDPYLEHRKFYPNCPYLKGIDKGNVPLNLTGSVTIDTIMTDEYADHLHNHVMSQNMNQHRGYSQDTLVTDCGPRRTAPHLLQDQANHKSASSTNMCNKNTGPVSFSFGRAAQRIPSPNPFQSLSHSTNGSQSIFIPSSSAPGIRPLSSNYAKRPNDMMYESNRQATFKDWPSQSSPMVPGELSKAGLYYTGTEDRVQCTWCNGTLHSWEITDVPCEEHKRCFPLCPFVNDPRGTGNVTLEQERGHSEARLDDDAAVVPNEDGQAAAMVPHNDTSMAPQPHNNATTMEHEENGCLNGEPEGTEHSENITSTPRHPEYAIEAIRLASFRHWPPWLIQTPELLARAGFFYAGFNDNVKCFHCAGGIRNWESEDDAWIEHARWFPRCAFLKRVKGEEFLTAVHEAFPKNATMVNTYHPPKEPAQAAGLHHIEQREVKARLDTPQVQAVLGMGYNKVLVMKVIEKRLKTTGDDFRNAEMLLQSVFEAEEAIEKGDDPFKALKAPEAAAISSSASNRSSATAASSSSAGSVEYVASSASASSTSAASAHTSMNTGARPKTASEHTRNTFTPTSMTEKKGQQSGVSGGKPKSGSKSLSHIQKSLPQDIEAETKSLMEENKALMESRTCKVCLDKEVEVVFLPCGHLVSCKNCAPKLRNCPICRALIRGTVKVFIP